MRKFFLWLAILLNIFLVVSCGNKTIRFSPTPTSADDGKGFLATQKNDISADEKIQTRLKQISETVKQTPSVLKLEGLDESQKIAQEIALNDEKFLRETKDKDTNAPLFNEIFGVYPLRDSDINQLTQNCKTSKCYRVEMYNFAANLTTNAIVDVVQKSIVVVTRSPATQPDIPDYLKDLAVHIAINSSEIIEALSAKPSEKDALMANTKTSLNRTRCERSLHLCVAPTFTKDGKALWAIVDLTDLNLVGARWTETGKTADFKINEKSLANDVLTKQFCETNNHLDQNGWAMDYILTSSDGLRISNVQFQNKPILNDAKLVDWHVSYSKTDGFGYSDAVGCPVFSQSAVVANVAPKIELIPKGFTLRQRYWSEGYPKPCNYSYEQRYEFYDDGSFRVAVASLGRGCGNDGTYRPVTRISFAGDQNNFAEWQTNDWKLWQTEQWNSQEKVTSTKEGFQYKLSDANGNGFYVEPSHGQFGDGGRGDNSFVYITKHHSELDEGDSDLTTIGPCCNSDYKQGPEKFIEPNPEPITNSPLILWYVAQLKNDDTKAKEYCWAESVVENGNYKIKEYPCFSGAMFRPILK